MPFNIPGILAPFQLLWNPRVILPHVVIAGLPIAYLFLLHGLILHHSKTFASSTFRHFERLDIEEPYLTRTIVWYVKLLLFRE